jgi:5'-nucleotidase
LEDVVGGLFHVSVIWQRQDGDLAFKDNIMNKKPFILCVSLAQALLFSQSAQALNIVISNDDGWQTNNIQTLQQDLVAAGHQVIISAPCTEQSGKGGAVNIFKPVPVDESKAAENIYCVGETDSSKSFADYSEGTPVMAALYGIQVAAQAQWQKKPDLLISGPNVGNNLGAMNENSGTIGAAILALTQEVPAIAVSAHQNSGTDASQGHKIAAVVVDIVRQLEATRPAGQPLLPPYMGLNINLPEEIDSNLGYKFTDIGWNGGGMTWAFASDLDQNPQVVDVLTQKAAEATGQPAAVVRPLVKQGLKGKQAVTIAPGDNQDQDEQSEGVAVKQGYITISTFDGIIQASSAKVQLTRQRLFGLAQE